jgi:hypothetical protein
MLRLPSLETLFLSGKKEFDRTTIDNFFFLLNLSENHDPFYYENKKNQRILNNGRSIQELCELDEKLFLSTAVSLASILFLLKNYFNEMIDADRIVNDLLMIKKITKKTTLPIVSNDIAKSVFINTDAASINISSINNIFIYNNILRELITKTTKLILNNISVEKKQILTNSIFFILNNKNLYTNENYGNTSFNKFYVAITKFLIKLYHRNSIFLDLLLINYFFYSNILTDFLKISNIKEYITINNSTDIDTNHFKLKKIELLFFVSGIKCIGFFTNDFTSKTKFTILDKNKVKSALYHVVPFSDHDKAVSNDDIFWLNIFKNIDKINKQLQNLD